MKEIPTSACDILSALGVNHTVRFTNSEFRAMPFRSLFGLSKLLKSYGIDSGAYELKDHALPEDMPLPFFAGVGGRYIVVTEVDGDRVEYLDGGTAKVLSRSRFDRLFNGIVMVCYPGDGACEPGYLLHRASKGGGQMLIGVAGRGWYQEEGKAPVEILPGTVINIPANVKHWHGAQADSWFAHLAFGMPGENTSTEWPEPVTDEEYDKLSK